MSLPTIRRVVTGHTPDGDAIIDSDKVLTPHEAFEPSKPGGPDTVNLTTIWRTSSFPASDTGSWTELHGTPVPVADKVGTTVRIVDIPPGTRDQMHRTLTMDFGVVLEGEVEMELDNGVKTVLKKNDVVVQRGTLHAWANVGDTTARGMFVLVPAEPVKIGDRTLEEERWR